VLAQTAAAADAAATVIANAVVTDDSRIVRKPANEIKDDSDLGDIAVTVEVPPLEGSVVENALRRGGRRASELRAAGLIWSAALVCQGRLLTTIDDDAILVQDRREVIRPLPLVHRGLVGAGND
jgi:hypothetical protein